MHPAQGDIESHQCYTHERSGTKKEISCGGYNWTDNENNKISIPSDQGNTHATNGTERMRIITQSGQMYPSNEAQSGRGNTQAKNEAFITILCLSIASIYCRLPLPLVGMLLITFIEKRFRLHGDELDSSHRGISALSEFPRGPCDIHAEDVGCSKTP